MADKTNKFNCEYTSWGDKDAALGPEGSSEHAEDFAQDSAGIPNPNQGEKTDLPLSFEPNKFPRQKGHDSLSAEEAQLT